MISKQPLRSESGFVLLVVLIITSLLMAVVANLVRETYIGAALVRGRQESMQAYQAASSGVYGGMALVDASLRTKQFSSLNDPWGKPLTYEREGVRLDLTIEDESGKLDVNKVVYQNGVEDDFFAPALRRLLESISLSPTLFASLADWIDSDDTSRVDGAETDYYRGSGKRYSASNRYVTSLEEVSLVKGFGKTAVEKIAAFITAGSPSASGAVNINTAPIEVLMSLHPSLTRDLAQRIVDFRNLTPFAATGDLANVVGMENMAIALQGRVCVKGFIYKIVSKARVGRAVSGVEAMVDLSSGRGRILSWKAI